MTPRTYGQGKEKRDAEALRNTLVSKSASKMSARIGRITQVVSTVLIPGQVLANTGVPVLTTTVTGLVLGLIPIVIVETLVLSKQINVSTLVALGAVTVANITSTLAGVGLAFLEILLTPFYVYDVTSSNLVVLALFVPLFFLSVVIEVPVVKIMIGSAEKQSLKRAVILANVGSYLMMSTFLLARMIKKIVVSGNLIVGFS